MNANRVFRIMVRILPAAFLAPLNWSVLAGGFRLPDQDAFATARGEAFVATADNASAVYYNPAGLAQLEGNNFRAGIYGIDLDPNYTPPGGSHTFHNEDKLHAVPQFFYSYSKTGSPITFGFGLYSPYGLGTRWPQDTGFRTVGTKAELTYITGSPAVAFQLARNFSIGGGLTVNYGKVDLRQGILSPNQGSDEFRFEGDGWDVGYILGALWKPHPKFSIGGTFRSATRIDFCGHTHARIDNAPGYPQTTGAHAGLSFPLESAFGISYRPTPKWNFEFDAEYTDWSTLGTVFIYQNQPLLGMNSIPDVFDWQSSWYYEFGGTRYFANGWHVSAGYILNENSVPDAHYSPLVTDMEKHFFSAGAGFKGRHFDFDVAYQFGYGPTRTVSGSARSPAGQTADGRYQFISHAVLVTAGLHF